MWDPIPLIMNFGWLAFPAGLVNGRVEQVSFDAFMNDFDPNFSGNCLIDSE